ncbi:MAG: hypothetical protein H6737_03835 [Alphaproteobacteria bacterium]|nr:hypothetical protein [Alphaproteobacteria bacterium]
MSIIATFEALPATGLTVTALNALDFAVPGKWSNPRDFTALIQEVSGIDKPGVVAQIRSRAQAMDLANTSHYAEALKVYQLVDTVDQVAAGAAMAGKVTDLFGSLGFLKQYTPKPETTQCVDAGVKLVAELVAFGLVNGMPSADPDALAKFTGALADYGRNDLLRIAAWVVYDGMVPLGPDFLQKILSTFAAAASNDSLTNNAVFQQLGKRLPGSGTAEKRAFILKTVEQTGDWVGRFVSERGLTHDKVMSNLKGVLSFADGGADYVAAAIDAGTAYMSHTGTQTVARALARHATDQMRDDVWKSWVNSQ